MKRLALFAVFTILVFSSAVAQMTSQARTKAVISTIPFWPPGGELPAELADRFFVYLDYQAQAYVVSYPEGLNTGRPDSGRRVQFRLEAPSAVESVVLSAVRKGAGGVFTYDYTVRNEISAKRAIGQFALVVASEDDSVSLSHPVWASDVPAAPPSAAPPGADPRGPALQIRAGAGRVVSWKGMPSNSIAPGALQAGFQLRSRFLPGITTAYGATGAMATMPADLPAPVREQLAQALAPENAWNSSVTIGPKFNPEEGPSRDPVWIATDYRLAVEKLRVGESIAKDSAFVQELIAVLDAVSGSGQRFPIRFRNTPGSPLEREIAEAARLALSSEN